MTLFSDEAVAALATLRTYVERYPTMGVSAALSTLDRAGAFAAIDEQADSPGWRAFWPSRPGRASRRNRTMSTRSGGRTGEFCSASSDCTWTYEEYLRNQSCTCGRSGERSPSQHAGGCPVWADHHRLRSGVDFSGSTFHGPVVGKQTRIDGS